MLAHTLMRLLTCVRKRGRFLLLPSVWRVKFTATDLSGTCVRACARSLYFGGSHRKTNKLT